MNETKTVTFMADDLWWCDLFRWPAENDHELEKTLTVLVTVNAEVGFGIGSGRKTKAIITKWSKEHFAGRDFYTITFQPLCTSSTLFADFLKWRWSLNTMRHEMEMARRAQASVITGPDANPIASSEGTS